MKRISILTIIIGLAVAFVFPTAARAQFLVVDCSGTNPYALFSNIHDALLAVSGPGAFIQVTGTCNENVFINGANNLSLGAPFGQRANLVGQLTILSSQHVYVYGLNVTNPNTSGEGVYVQTSSVIFDTFSSSGNAGNGMQVTQTSDVTVTALGTFNNNGGYGIYNDANSFVYIISWAGITDISNNQRSALWNTQANFVTFGNTHMANNGQVAIDMRGGGKTQMGAILGSNVIENNPNGGASLQENAEISFFSLSFSSGPDIIRNNGSFGVEAGFGSQVTLAGAQITGHTGPAVDVYAHSQLYGTSQLPGLTATEILNNGAVGDPLSAAVRVDGNSEALLRGVNVSQNNGPAILALVNSSADFAGNTFSGNTGIITCDSTSTMVSDLPIASRNPASGVACTTAHTLGNRSLSAPTPAVPDISVWKKMHSDYQQRSAAQK